MRILVTGSLAYDNIMDFPGKFSEHILPNKIHILNVSLLVKELKQQFGGTAGNISYNLSMFRLRPKIYASAGGDFGKYKKWLIKKNVDIKHIKIIRNVKTAVAHIVTDKEDNQICAFYPGAISHESESPTNETIKSAMLGIISPTNVKDMVEHSQKYKRMKLPYMFDPGQQIPALSKSQINTCITGAKIFIANDYELSLVLKKTGMKKQQLLSKVEILVTTLGELGSIIETQKEKIEIPAAHPKIVEDPTGAGDAYRAGFIAGYVKHLPLKVCGRMGSVAAVYAVEQYGTQEHAFTINEFRERYRVNFKENI